MSTDFNDDAQSNDAINNNPETSGPGVWVGLRRNGIVSAIDLCTGIFIWQAVDALKTKDQRGTLCQYWRQQTQVKQPGIQ